MNLLFFASKRILLYVFSCTLLFACAGKNTKKTEKSISLTKDVELITNKGTVLIRLYDETPKHRDNFLKLVKDGYYNGIQFHRVIENFMIQAGDATTKKEVLGDTTALKYTIPAEFKKQFFHKRGALGAAREDNLDRASDATHFYIVQGKVYNDSTLDVAEKRINNWLALNRVVNKKQNKVLVQGRDSLRELESSSEKLEEINIKLKELSQQELSLFENYSYPTAHRSVYKTQGGAAHLDQNYTVFGEILRGMDIVDKIAATATDDKDKPVEDIIIITAKLVERKNP